MKHPLVMPFRSAHPFQTVYLCLYFFRFPRFASCYQWYVRELDLFLCVCVRLRLPFPTRSMHVKPAMDKASRIAHTFSCINSIFFASRSSFGTPWALDCALRHKFHSSLQNLGVSLSKNPVSLIWRSLISGCVKQNQQWPSQHTHST